MCACVRSCPLIAKLPGGAGPTYVSIHPSGNFLLVANYFGGSVSVLPILPDGRLGKATDIKKLAPTDRTLYYRVHANLTQLEKRQAIRGLQANEARLKGDLDRRLKEIEAEYQAKLAAIEAETNKSKKPKFTAIGILKHAPDLLGKRPSHRLVEGNKIRYYLISTSYDLSRFAGKRVGVVGLLDPESGTGRYTIMVRRIEILGEE